MASSGIPYTATDHGPEVATKERREGAEVYYGSAVRNTRAIRAKGT
jgi:hypothetical protein